MFFRHHFGQLAIGLSNADVSLSIYRRLFSENHIPTDHNFFSITSGGVDHPWTPRGSHGKDDFAVRVAIVGDKLRFEEEDFYGTETQLFAKVEWNVNCEVYLGYRCAGGLIGSGLPDPCQMAATIIKVATDHVNGKESVIGVRSSGARWVVVDKKQVPNKFRSLLGKVMSRVQSSIGQGADFFRNPKFR